jgi:hypothetical protein
MQSAAWATNGKPTCAKRSALAENPAPAARRDLRNHQGPQSDRIRRAPSVDYLDLLQWPAMAVTVLAAWLVASTKKSRRGQGFWVFLLSNVLWIAWGWHSNAYALIALQFCLAAMNIRGARKAETATSPDAASG